MLLTDPAPSRDADNRRHAELEAFKSRVHRDVVAALDLDVILKTDAAAARQEVTETVRFVLERDGFPLTAAEKRQFIDEIVNATFGLGPLEPLLKDRTVDEILVNNPHTVYVERAGRLVKTDVAFKDAQHLRHVINRIVARVGRRIDEASPMVDARLPDGSRVNAIIPPLALDGPALCIRRFKEVPFTAKDLVRIGTMSAEMLCLLEMAVRSKVNILIAGGTGSGKTTLLNVLSSFIPNDERILTIEDAAELQLQQPHVVRLETRPANSEGKGLVSQRELVRNSLRMRPDRIVLGEVRGAEALDMLQAMNTGHDGSLTTVHSNSTRDALSRIETMVLMSNANMSQTVINRQIASAIQLVVYARRFTDGGRRVESISEITGMEGSVITMQEIAHYVQTGVGADGRCIGEFKIRPVKPKFLERARMKGVTGAAA